MLEITGDEIAQLNDSDLRSLIGLLCEADLSSMQLQTSGVTWGGNQNAKDGGIDVRVEANSLLMNDGFIPRPHTAFQVKKPDMPRSEILLEMRPNKILRQVIKDLADNNGAYIIISSQGSTSDSSLKSRKLAMLEAISDYNNASQLKVDFYDRERVASWVRSHPAIVLWVRDKIGQPIQGWQAFSNWANHTESTEEEYLLDGTSRLSNSSSVSTESMDLLQGIHELRTILGRPGSSVRLIGLSGVGKTRLVQALFDKRIGEEALNNSLAFYTDLGDAPIPDPRSFAARLKTLRKRGILIVDNCPPDLHNHLTKLYANDNYISLLTIEYDVRDDHPEQTAVFRLEPSSTEIIEKVISRRFKHINSVTVRQIAKISGGNARVAIAIARTISIGDNISHLRDAELFNRLFIQRNNTDSKLLKAAEICSLVYSFSIDTVGPNSIEITLLAELSGMSVLELYQNIAELKRRDLVQQRSSWRAVLPHAIANKLAQNALENLPKQLIRSTFEVHANPRLLQSFSRRLGYLHNSQLAQEISKDWLSSGGLLEDFRKLNKDTLNILRNVAPLHPQLVLSRLEEINEQDNESIFFSRENSDFYYYTNLLRSLAYDSDLFERSTRLLCNFALTENVNENHNSIRTTLKSLFYIYLSGTHASVEQRLRIISCLIESDLDNEVKLGIYLLDASLEALNFSAINSFNFGAHVRDYGYYPKSKEEIQTWYGTFIEYAVTIGISDKPFANEIKVVLCNKFRGLWTRAKVYEVLESAVKRILAAKETWYEAWYAVKKTKRYDSDRMSDEVSTRLDSLYTLLEPRCLYDEVMLLTLQGQGYPNDIFETEEAFTKVKTLSYELGHKLCYQEDILNSLLIHLLSTNNRNIYDLGQGLAQGASDAKRLWTHMVEKLSEITPSNRKYHLLQGFLYYLVLTDKSSAEEILDEAIDHELLSEVFPSLQSVVIDTDGLDRLKRSLQLGKAPISSFGSLALIETHDIDFNEKFFELIRLISSKEDGLAVAIELFYMRIFRDNKDLSQDIISLGQELVLNYDFTQRSFENHHFVSEIIKICFRKVESTRNAKRIATKLYSSITEDNVFFSDLDHVFLSLVEVQPLEFLEVFVRDTEEMDYRIAHIFSGQLNLNPLNLISDELIINWCDVKKTERYPLMASIIDAYQNTSPSQQIEWTSIAKYLIDNYFEPTVILEQLMHVFHPNHWSDSLADVMLKRLPLLESLLKYENPIVVEWAKNKEPILKKEINRIRNWEQAQEQNQNERFE
ncbi:hypothetical protein [Paenibacillus sp. OK076]|uniref:hypothetical protein n=1 Tax=Paenibacillus sp. OK076 TaxID=1884379 RepID=UPI0008D1A668|nr:hypothetical protein [Paenibacillus sp. OK076]SEN67529.1 hypothetical protein SAMN05518670_2402 [Paenibacillus sp. OK076]